MTVSSLVYYVHFQLHCPLISIVAPDTHLQNSWVELVVQTRAMDESRAQGAKQGSNP